MLQCAELYCATPHYSIQYSSWHADKRTRTCSHANMQTPVRVHSYVFIHGCNACTHACTHTQSYLCAVKGHEGREDIMRPTLLNALVDVETWISVSFTGLLCRATCTFEFFSVIQVVMRCRSIIMTHTHTLPHLTRSLTNISLLHTMRYVSEDINKAIL